MGPADISTDSASTIKVTSLPKLTADGSNWTTYQDRVTNAIKAKGLRRHLSGTARKPEDLKERNGNFFKPRTESPLTDDQLEAHEKEIDDYEQKEATLREIIYGTIDRSTFVQIKGETTAAGIWKKLQSIHADKGSMFETDLITQLQTIRFSDGDSMRTHLTKMTELHDRLAEIGAPITDASFNSYIRSSLSLTPRYQPLFTALSTTAHETGKPITSTSLVWHLSEEANNVAIEANINRANAAMIAAHAKGSGSSGRGKDKDKPKGKTGRKQCTNCKLKGHVKETCFAKGGGQEHDVPDWWKEKQAAKGKKEPEKSANAASKDSMKDDNYALITIPAGDDSHIEDAETHFVLVVTSGHDHNAHAVSPSVGVIIDCGASSHFSPDRSKFLDYEDIDPEPIKAADGHASSAIGKGDIRITLPACKGIQNVTICLKGVYYAPSMAFTLISVSCLDRAGCLLLIEDEICVI